MHPKDEFTNTTHATERLYTSLRSIQIQTFLHQDASFCIGAIPRGTITALAARGFVDLSVLCIVGLRM